MIMQVCFDIKSFSTTLYAHIFNSGAKKFINLKRLGSSLSLSHVSDSAVVVRLQVVMLTGVAPQRSYIKIENC